MLGDRRQDMDGEPVRSREIDRCELDTGLPLCGVLPRSMTLFDLQNERRDREFQVRFGMVAGAVFCLFGAALSGMAMMRSKQSVWEQFHGSAPYAVLRTPTKRRGRGQLRSGLSQFLHLKAGAAWPGSTMTELNSPHRPHCLTSLVGSFTIGTVPAAMARSAWARSSALVSGGPRRRSFMGGRYSGRAGPVHFAAAAFWSSTSTVFAAFA
jgi:hypothetical protein